MRIWTVIGFKGIWTNSSIAIVCAEDEEMAIILLEKQLKNAGLKQKITKQDLKPFPTSSRLCRVFV